MAERNKKYIPEEPRKIDVRPLLKKIYEWHEEKMAKFAKSPCLEIGFGKKPSKVSNYGLEPEQKNCLDSPDNFLSVRGSGHKLPFKDSFFRTVIIRRAIHHLDPEIRDDFIEEVERVLKKGGKFIIIEGTPGKFRKKSKAVARKLNLLGKDNDEYGHLTKSELEDLLKNWKITKNESLGSPFMIFSELKGAWSKAFFPIYKKTQFIDWWQFIVAKKE